MRCARPNKRGSQCGSPAITGSTFCKDHQPEVANATGGQPSKKDGNWIPTWFWKSWLGPKGLSGFMLVPAIIYLLWVCFFRTDPVLSTLIAGACPPFDLPPSYTIPRKELIDQLAVILTPPPRRDTFFLITGEHGTGKTTSALMACNQVRQGVIYTKVPVRTQSFGKEVGSAIGFQFDEYITPISLFSKLFDSPKASSSPEPGGSWDRLWPSLLKAAEDFGSNYGRPPVLIIDNVNLLARFEPTFFDTLILLAKEHVQQIVFVFVSSEGNGPALMMEQSSWSRGKIFEVEDMLDEEAVDYLKKKGIPEAVALPTVAKITGGRLTLLNKVEASFDETWAVLESDCSRDFDAAGLFAENTSTKPWKAVEQILKTSNGIPLELFRGIVSEKNYLRLLEKQVFSLHLQTRRVTMQSRAAERYAQEILTRETGAPALPATEAQPPSLPDVHVMQW